MQSILLISYKTLIKRKEELGYLFLYQSSVGSSVVSSNVLLDLFTFSAGFSLPQVLLKAVLADCYSLRDVMHNV